MLSENDVKAELSYAYLHAVAAQAQFGCEVRSRHLDNAGVDATISVRKKLSESSILTDFSMDIQLKATATQLSVQGGQISYPLRREHYDKLRIETILAPRYLVLLCLPGDKASWLKCTLEELTFRKSAHWVSLRGAANVDNETSVTVHIPEQNLLTPESLHEIALRFSIGEYFGNEH